MRKRERRERSRETGCRRGQARGRGGREEGQAMVEMTLGVVFLLIIVVALFEMAMLFHAYVSLLNASREGAMYASAHPNMEEGTEEYDIYEAITRAEALASGLNIDPIYLEVFPPEPTGPIEPGEGIRVSVRYELVNPTQGIILPLVERMGLWRTIMITASTEMPIR